MLTKQYKKILILAVLLFLLCPFVLDAQFYNGHQMSFGKNRVQYREFLWQFYRFDKFDTYYYVNGKELAEFTGKIAQEEIPRFEDYFQHALEKRIIFLIYNKLSDFKQSNIGLVSDGNDANIGGRTRIVNNKVFLYFEGDRKKFEQQIKAAIIEVIMNEMIYGTDFKDKVANSTLLALPEWYQKGLISYLSRGWDFEIENHVRDAILNGRYEKFNRIPKKEAVYAGHSIWNYIADEYGKGIIPNIVYLTRIHKNTQDGFLFVLGISFESLTYEWLYHYKDKYSKELGGGELPNIENLINKPKEKYRITQPKLSPQGNKIAYVTNQMGQYKIYIYNKQSGKNKRIFKKEYKLDQETDYSFPLLAWHPTGKLLTFIIERKGKVLLNLYNIETKKTEVMQMHYFEKILDYSYSDDGFKLVMSATIKGQSDIWVHKLLSHTNEQLTHDFADDAHPRFINNSTKIIFSSNRANPVLFSPGGPDVETTFAHDIFILDYESKNRKLTQITNTPVIDEVKPFGIGKKHFSYLSNKNGIFNRYMAYVDSTISYIDTTTHYRYFTKAYPCTNLSYNLIDFDINKNMQSIDLIWFDGSDHLFTGKISTRKKEKKNLKTTSFRNRYTKDVLHADSLKKAKTKRLEKEIEELSALPQKISTDTLIDISSYTFEQEKQGSPIRKKLLINQKKAEEFTIPISQMYFTSFYSNYMVNQIDFSFLNASYQTFTGGAVYYNPGLNFFFKLGVSELFEDYRITGGFRLSGSFESNEYLVSFENLKDRIDKQIILHRQTFREIYAEYAAKNYTHEIMIIRKYPFSQVAAVKGTASMRYDKNVFLSTDNQTLLAKSYNKTWGGLKIEYIFDNTINKGLNLYNGVRLKVFGEAYWEIEKNTSDLYVVGADVRWYQKLHHDIIWANRFAASTSFGRNRLIYYMGSVDNWFSFLSSEQVFDQSVAIDRTQHFVYQTLATNMRGFSQNVRNGNSFALINSEIRVPIVKYLARRPISNEFFKNLQFIGFTDVGTAWSGATPYSRNNAYNYLVEDNGPITIVINKDIEPIVYGYGFGVRSRLLGYFIRADWAWGVEDQIVQPRIFYLSLSTDF
ncbi:MAG: hypothetical protein U9R19_10940 [Bacteroidota bacterium]|nr:hypothetical protein [Bacteroidota bacterium]